MLSKMNILINQHKPTKDYVYQSYKILTISNTFLYL